MEKQIGRVAALSLRPAKGAAAAFPDALRLVAEWGIEGDFHFQGGDGSVSLLCEQARNWMARQAVPGLCFRKYQENLLLSGVDLPSLRPKDRLHIGEEAVLTVTAVGKRCFPGCAYPPEKTPCLLKSCAAFAIVSQSGTVRVGDPVTVISAHPAEPPPAP